MPSQRTTKIKVCGLTRAQDIEHCVRLGVDAIGLNFVPQSPRCLTVDRARELRSLIPNSVLAVGVVADLSFEDLCRLRDDLGLDCLQLHGDEPPALVERLLPHCYKAFRVATLEDLARIDSYPGAFVLVDAKVEGALGGTGHQVPPELVCELAKRRKLTLAGGLRPDNVASAIAIVRPYCVDVASGVEPKGQPGVKDASLVEAFVRAVENA